VAKDFSRIPPNKLHWYNGCDVSATLRLYHQQRGRMGPFLGTFRDLIQPAFWALGHVERWGALPSERNLRLYDQHLQTRIQKARDDLSRFPQVPADLNPKSPKQMQALLFGTLGMKAVRKTKAKAPSADADSLEELHALYPQHGDLIQGIKDLSSATNMRSMYGVEYLKHVGFDGRVHTTYRIVRTQRLASKQPNLQNLKSPDDGDEEDDGKWARSVYVCPDGYVIVSLDYGQLELRVPAILSGDDVMIDAFLAGKDFHRVSAAGVFKKPEEDVTKLERRIGKVLNFKNLFGGGAYALAKDLTFQATVQARKDGKPIPPPVTEKAAQGYIDGWWRTFPKLSAWAEEQMARGKAQGESWARYMNWCMRRQATEIGIVGDSPAANRVRKHWEHVLLNNPIQTIANCFALEALYRCVADILDNDLPAQLAMTIHDALVFYLREDCWQDLARRFRHHMTNFDTGRLPLKVDCEMSRSDFGHMDKVDLDA
jgi:DNA polymerase I